MRTPQVLKWEVARLVQEAMSELVTEGKHV